MSENIEPTENNEQNNEEEEEPVVCLKEVLEIEHEMDEGAAALLGALSDQVCSYSEGYMKRQALYSCLTCLPECKDDPEKGAGICLACCYHCHDSHELVELYTKRNFRCDCGNSKFNGVKCNLIASKDEINDKNTYNQNFGGLYCNCHRPFPDPEDALPDEMIQCIICEDWYHSRHLGCEIPSESCSEMICGGCVKNHQFLLHYDPNKPIEVTETTTSESEPAVKSEEVPEKKCKKPETKSDIICAKFWQNISWRSDLCTCEECLELYKTENVAFLIDLEDSVNLYEEKGKAKTKEVEETRSRDFFNSMGRVQLVEVLAGYNDLKQNLGEFLQTFSENKRVIRETDVKEFFDGMLAKKKQKLSAPPPHFCR